MDFENKIGMWVDNIDHFVGDEINEEKARTLDLMREKCRKITEYEFDIEFPFDGFNNRQRTVTMALESQGALCLFDRRSLMLMSELFAMADFASFAESDGCVRATFTLFDMWEKFHYDNDMEHGK